MAIFWNDGTSLYHYGIPGMKWGVRNGPPYPLGSEQKTKREKKKDYQDKYYEKHTNTSNNSGMTAKSKKELIKKVILSADDAYEKLREERVRHYENINKQIDERIVKETGYKSFEALEDAAMREDPNVPYEKSLWNLVNKYEFELYDLAKEESASLKSAQDDYNKVIKDFVVEWVDKNGSLRYDESILDYSPTTYNSEHQTRYYDIETLIDDFIEDESYQWRETKDGKAYEIVKVK